MGDFSDIFANIFNRKGKDYNLEECIELITKDAALMNAIHIQSILTIVVQCLIENNLLDMNTLAADAEKIKQRQTQKQAAKLQKELNDALSEYLSE